MTWWWLSFCDLDRPKGSQFRGAVIVEGDCLHLATARAHELGVAPATGRDEVVGLMIDAATTIPSEWRNRLMTKEDAAAFDKAMESR